MPLITIIFFFIFLGLLLALLKLSKNMKKLKAAKEYGRAEFDIDLPAKANASKASAARGFPPFTSLSDSEAFFVLITPYIGSLNKTKRNFLYQSLNDLKNDLKINKNIYQYFADEFQIYDGLSEAEAAAKWAEK